MWALIAYLKPPDFNLNALNPTRTRGVVNGRCVWSCYYELVNPETSIIGRRNFLAAVRKLTSKLPVGSRVLSYGRYRNHFGISIQLECTQCTCPVDFKHIQTLFANFAGKETKTKWRFQGKKLLFFLIFTEQRQQWVVFKEGAEIEKFLVLDWVFQEFQEEGQADEDEPMK